MHKIYEAMQARGEIGPMEMRGGQLQFREWREYPKMLYPDGKGPKDRAIVVKDLNEEVAVMGGLVKEDRAPDPLEAERQKLLEATEAMKVKERGLDEEIAKMKAQLAEFQAQMGAQQESSKGSKFRPKTEGDVSV